MELAIPLLASKTAPTLLGQSVITAIEKIQWTNKPNLRDPLRLEFEFKKSAPLAMWRVWCREVQCGSLRRFRLTCRVITGCASAQVNKTISYTPQRIRTAVYVAIAQPPTFISYGRSMMKRCVFMRICAAFLYCCSRCVITENLSLRWYLLYFEII